MTVRLNSMRLASATVRAGERSPKLVLCSLPAFPEIFTRCTWMGNTPSGRHLASASHGMLTLSAATGLWMMEPGVVLAFYGIDSLRFVRPVKIGDTIYVESEVKRLTERGEEAGLVTVHQRIVNQREETVVDAVVHVLVAREGNASARA
ncbi:MaoC domain protein dehydratase [Geobacillus thermoleovorans CCB_US3_UF5]|uniref:MaoC domain protein dehydratase n=1 Tax=Geobacillus thermoleovorans CCB_US3_UF5 TaxID=1111068 RepID=A0ABM5MJI5_GEOTH|nr:MaoC domain protein dehydratase [Geobacillus thermoleovorans CCB_US3_UF5]